MNATRTDVARRPILGGFFPLLDAWIAGDRQIFPSEPSTRWFLRRHKAELIEAGALVKFAGSWNFHPEKFQAVVLEVARRETQAALHSTRPAA